MSFEDLPVSIADFISAIWGPKNTLLNGKLGSSPAVTKMAAKLLNQRTLERLTGTGRGAEGPPREDEGPSRRDDWGSRSGSSSSDDEYWSSSSRWDDDEPSRSDPRDNSSYRRSSSPSSSNNNNGSSGATRRKKKRSTLTRRLAPYVVSANTLLNKWTPLHTKGPSENEELVGQFRSAVHLVDVALMQAAPSMQLGSNTTVGPTNLSRLEAMRSKAEAIVESARELIYDAEGCSVEADVARKEADQLSRMAVEAQDMSVQLQKSAEEAVRVARKAIARLKGKEEEVSIQDLHQVAAERLLAAVNQVQLAPPLLESSGSGGAGGGGVGGAAGSVPDLQVCLEIGILLFSRGLVGVLHVVVWCLHAVFPPCFLVHMWCTIHPHPLSTLHTPPHTLLFPPATVHTHRQSSPQSQYLMCMASMVASLPMPCPPVWATNTLSWCPSQQQKCSPRVGWMGVCYIGGVYQGMVGNGMCPRWGGFRSLNVLLSRAVHGRHR